LTGNEKRRRERGYILGLECETEAYEENPRVRGACLTLCLIFFPDPMIPRVDSTKGKKRVKLRVAQLAALIVYVA